MKISKAKALIIISLVIAAYWWTVVSVDVYSVGILGAVYEILWLPMLLSMAAVPIISLVFLIKEKFKLNSLYYWPILILGLSFIYFQFFLD